MQKKDVNSFKKMKKNIINLFPITRKNISKENNIIIHCHNHETQEQLKENKSIFNHIHNHVVNI